MNSAAFAQFAVPELPPSSSGSWDGGNITTNTNLADDIQLSFGTSTDFACEYDTAQTPDAMVCGTSSDSNNFIITEKADIGTDFALPASSDPTLYIHSNDESQPDEWVSIFFDSNLSKGIFQLGGEDTYTFSFEDSVQFYGTDLDIGTALHFYATEGPADISGDLDYISSNRSTSGASADGLGLLELTHIFTGSGTQSGYHRGGYFNIRDTGSVVQTGTGTSAMVGGYFLTESNSTGASAEVVAIKADAFASISGSSVALGTISDQSGIKIQTGYSSGTSSTGIITSSKGIQIQSPSATSAGRTIPDYYGLKIENAEATGITNAYAIHTGTGRHQFGGNVEFSNGKAMTASLYQIGRDADGTNQLHFNVPTSSNFEFSVNDGPELVLSATNLNLKDNQITWDGGQAVTAGAYSVGRDADATNQLHFNVPNGASMEFSVNDVNVMTVTGSALVMNNQPVQNIGASGTDFGGSGQLTLGNGASASGTSALTINMGAHTAVSTNVPALVINGYTNTINSGSSIANSSAMEIQNQTYNGVAGGGTEQVTDAATLRIVNSPVQGTNVTLVNRYGLLVDGGYSRFDGRINAAKGAGVASAATITLSDGNFFIITGTTNIDCITTTGWTPGSIAYLDFSGALTVNDSTGGCGANTANVNLSAAYVTTANDTLTIAFDGTSWVEIARSVN